MTVEQQAQGANERQRSMEEGLNAIFWRRSIREYTGAPVSDEQVQQLLRAAMAAPSAGNEQPWKFVVIRDRELLNRAAGADGGLRMLRSAAVGILVCGEPRLTKYQGFWPQDCAAATQNIVIAAQILQLGAAWMGLYPIGFRIRRVRRIFGLPWQVVPFAFVSIGYPAEQKPPPERFDPRRVHRDRWSPQQDNEIAIASTKAVALFLKRHIRNFLRK